MTEHRGSSEHTGDLTGRSLFTLPTLTLVFVALATLAVLVVLALI